MRPRPDKVSLVVLLRRRPFFDVVIPGLYAWLATVGWSLRGEQSMSYWTHGFAAAGLVALIACGVAVAKHHRNAGTIAGAIFVSASAAIWFLEGARSDNLGPLGSLGWAAFSMGWIRACGERGEQPFSNVEPLALPPRRIVPWAASTAMMASAVAACVPLVLSFQVADAGRALLSHALALLGALQILSGASELATSIGQSASRSNFPWASLARTSGLVILVVIGCWFTFAVS
jgi:hypothetical protein